MKFKSNRNLLLNKQIRDKTPLKNTSKIIEVKGAIILRNQI